MFLPFLPKHHMLFRFACKITTFFANTDTFQIKMLHNLTKISTFALNLPNMINYDLRSIKAIIFDVDGVLSQSTIQMGPEGNPLRTLNIKDGYAIQLAVKMGLRLAIISGGTDKSVEQRYKSLGMNDIFMSCSTKIEVYSKYLADNGLTYENVIYVGDDIPDYEIMKLVGCPCCPADACPDIKKISRYVSPYNGGMGCARDIIEQVLRAQGHWLSSAKAFGW